MYRVELKVDRKSTNLFCNRVPNVPCGVESSEQNHTNAQSCSFLMYRVELKVYAKNHKLSYLQRFLMYRVELKEQISCYIIKPKTLFLMYRVELKVSEIRGWGLDFDLVPNVPCGVERLGSQKKVKQ